MELRAYQQEAVDAFRSHLATSSKNPCIVIPTAGGKTPIIATICREAVESGQRVVVLSHVKELIEQTIDKLKRIAPDIQCGINSAGLGRRDTQADVVVAGIQSVHKRPELLGRRDLVIVDECHLIPSSGFGMYRKFFSDSKIISPHQRVLGLTATPFRLGEGMICGADSWLHEIIYDISVRELIEDGYLCPLRTKSTAMTIDTAKLHKRAGEFVSEEVDLLMRADDIVAGACEEIVRYTEDRHAVLVFATNVRHAEDIAARLQRAHGVYVECVFGHTSDGERKRIIQRFRDGSLKYLVNCDVLTTGFDAPHIDCVAIVRPTLSPGLYYQMVGRGFRLHPDKANCLVLDYGGNALRHGPVDDLRIKARSEGGGGNAPAKTCSNCYEIVPAACRECPDCGSPFADERTVRHDIKASDAPVLSDGSRLQDSLEQVYTTYLVEEMNCVFWISRKSGKPSARVRYFTTDGKCFSDWLSFESDGKSKYIARDWISRFATKVRNYGTWKNAYRCPPKNCEEAVELINQMIRDGAFYRSIEVDENSEYQNVKKRHFEHEQSQAADTAMKT